MFQQCILTLERTAVSHWTVNLNSWLPFICWIGSVISLYTMLCVRKKSRVFLNFDKSKHKNEKKKLQRNMNYSHAWPAVLTNYIIFSAAGMKTGWRGVSDRPAPRWTVLKLQKNSVLSLRPLQFWILPSLRLCVLVILSCSHASKLLFFFF